MSYNFVKPNAERASYSPDETVDFIVKYDGYNLVPHIRISGTLSVPAQDGTANIYMDGMAGADGLFKYFTAR